jgi:AraC-like DNA-binding protein
MNAATSTPPTTSAITAQESRTLVAQLKRSAIYRDYEKAFRESTGLPIALRPIEAFDLPHHGDPKESPFCALVAQSNHSCAACLLAQKQITDGAGLEAKTLRCFAGLCDSAVPVRVGENLIAFLQTGQVLLHAPERAEFTKATRELLKLGGDIDVKRMEEAYFQTRVVTREQYDSIVRLLTIFAQHLSVLSNQLMVQGANQEMPAITRAREIIAQQFATELSLSAIAAAVNMSAFYFCKTFKQATGMTFTDYLARVRVEKVKHLLLNPNTRISEAAYAAGFQSLSQFNRVFRRITGRSPTLYRERVPGT